MPEARKPRKISIAAGEPREIEASKDPEPATA